MSTATYVVLGAPVLVGFGALAVDIGWMADEKARLQAATDATAMAAASHLNTLDDGVVSTPDNHEYQVFLAGAAYSSKNWEQPLLWEELDIGTWDADTRSWESDRDNGEYVRVIKTGRVMGIFGGIFGRSTHEVTAMSVAHALVNRRETGYAYGVYPCGIYADTSLDVSGNWTVDSYDSDAGPYNQVDAQDGEDIDGAMCSNGTLTASSAAWDGWINALAGPGLTPGGNGIDEIEENGGYLGTMEEETEFPSVVVPSGAMAPPSAANNGTITLGQSGSYHFTSGLSLSANDVLRVPAGVEVDIYVTGDVNISHDNLDNVSLLPNNVRIHVVSGSVSFNDNSEIYANIYAPDSAINVNGGGTFYGALVGDTITGNGSMDFHLDNSIAEDDGRTVIVEGSEEVQVVATALVY